MMQCTQLLSKYTHLYGVYCVMNADFAATVRNAVSKHESYCRGSVVSHWLQSAQDSRRKTNRSLQDAANPG